MKKLALILIPLILLASPGCDAFHEYLMGQGYTCDDTGGLVDPAGNATGEACPWL